jgi:hypothetical protein
LEVLKKFMGLALLLCSLPSGAQGVKCIGVGWLNLGPPSNTIYCRANGNTGKILWGVTYSAEKNQLILWSSQMHSQFGVPAQPNQRYIGSAVRGTSDAWYSMTTGFYEDDHRVFINLEGH